ncbi:MAG: hypothetical protein ACRDXX_09190 [Stackebrandtia sp.]
MIDWLTSAVQICALAAACWMFVDSFRAKPVTFAHLVGLGGLEVLLVAQAVVSTVLLARLSGGADNTILFVGYLATAVLILPVAAIWGLTDRSRWGSAVAGGASLSVAAILMRMDQIWQLMNG